MTFFITGGAGYIGQHLASKLSQSNERVVIIDKKPQNNFLSGLSNIAMIELDISKEESLLGMFSLFQNAEHNDVIFHLAARKSMSESFLHPNEYLDNNLGGTRNVISALRNSKMKNIIFSSSASVYGDSAERPNELTTLKPSSPYALSKVLEETLLRNEAASNNMNVLIFRFFNVAGAASPNLVELEGENLIPKAVSCAIQNRNFFVNGVDYSTHDGSCVRDYIHVSDVVDALIKGAAHVRENTFEILNLGTGNGYSVLEILRNINNHIDLAIEFGPRRLGDQASIIADVGKTSKILRWKSKSDILETISSSIPHL